MAEAAAAGPAQEPAQPAQPPQPERLVGERKVTVILSSVLFLTAAVLSAAALGSPSWLVEDFQGSAKFGLFHECRENMYGATYQETCTTSSSSAAWRTAGVFLILGTIAAVAAGFFAILSYVKASYLTLCKWSGFVAGIFYSLTSIVLPIGFDQEEIGGEPFKLPDHTSIGSAYVWFIVSLMSVFLGELFALKVICPARR